MKIVDCFTFYNELDLLTYRLNLLDNIVDYFIIVESTHTHVGKEKTLFFNENKHLFQKFTNKIIHIIVDDFPHKYNNVAIATDKVWENESFQRNAISRGINSVKDLTDTDMIIISDLDEIPDPFTLNKIKTGNIIVDLNVLEMDFYYYNLNTKYPDHKWCFSVILSYKKYKNIKMNCNTIRNKHKKPKDHVKKIPNGGWHLSYFGDKYFIQNKIQNFAHQEFNKPVYTNIENIEKIIQTSTDIYSRKHIKLAKIKIEDNTYLPPYYDKYLTKYYN